MGNCSGLLKKIKLIIYPARLIRIILRNLRRIVILKKNKRKIIRRVTWQGSKKRCHLKSSPGAVCAILNVNTKKPARHATSPPPFGQLATEEDLMSESERDEAEETESGRAEGGQS